MSNDDDFLSSGGAPSAKFANIGDTVKGTILSIEKKQQTDPKTLKPKFWDDGNPMWQHVFTLQTDARDPEIEDDDGKRRLFVAGSTDPEKKSLKSAVTVAMQKAGAKPGMLIGGKLAVKFTGERASTVRGFAPAKEYEAKFEKPVPSDDFGDEEPF